ncbi:hypothetical protein GC176_05855 [bacterium]|nr:hypothetical protein [bacterium]
MRFFRCCVIAVCLLTVESVSAAGAEDVAANASSIFDRRIRPILQSKDPSSCTQCHFAAVELRDYILDNEAQTFASLKANGMIDVEHPDESKILRFIGRKPEKSDALIDRVRHQEYAAFRDWIRVAVREPKLLKASSSVDVGTKLPPEVIRHARRDRVLSSFVDNVWSEIGRCLNCHSPERNRDKIGRNGLTKEDVDGISWIVPRDPAGTLQKLLDGGNIDLEDPAGSPFLTKPAGLSEHKGGPKFFPGSPTYRNWLTFLTDFAAIKNGKYASANDLPQPQRELLLLSEQQLRITNLPDRFSGLALQVDLYVWDATSKQWSADRVATGFSRVNGKQQVWQNPILLTAQADSKQAEKLREHRLLPAGTYLAKFLVDYDRRTEKDPTYALSEKEFVAQVEIRGEWKPGYQPPRIVAFPVSR